MIPQRPHKIVNDLFLLTNLLHKTSVIIIILSILCLIIPIFQYFTTKKSKLYYHSKALNFHQSTDIRSISYCSQCSFLVSFLNKHKIFKIDFHEKGIHVTCQHVTTFEVNKKWITIIIPLEFWISWIDFLIQFIDKFLEINFAILHCNI